mmetsp:Transcript_40796/g.103364  ORF Transcript_40796/g.103364 Transcript_40796/m.103364 type:complete len:396 (+) Transcript_40796:626-1813(+)
MLWICASVTARSCATCCTCAPASASIRSVSCFCIRFICSSTSPCSALSRTTPALAPFPSAAGAVRAQNSSFAAPFVSAGSPRPVSGELAPARPPREPRPCPRTLPASMAFKALARQLDRNLVRALRCLSNLALKSSMLPMKNSPGCCASLKMGWKPHKSRLLALTSISSCSAISGTSCCRHQTGIISSRALLRSVMSIASCSTSSGITSLASMSPSSGSGRGSGAPASCPEARYALCNLNCCQMLSHRVSAPRNTVSMVLPPRLITSSLWYVRRAASTMPMGAGDSSPCLLRRHHTPSSSKLMRSPMPTGNSRCSSWMSTSARRSGYLPQMDFIQSWLTFWFQASMSAGSRLDTARMVWPYRLAEEQEMVPLRKLLAMYHASRAFIFLSKALLRT